SPSAYCVASFLRGIATLCFSIHNGKLERGEKQVVSLPRLRHVREVLQEGLTMPSIRIETEDLRTIAASCQTSSENMTTEATNIRTQIANLHQALQGVPQLALADHFDQLNRIFSQVSDALAESNTYLNDVVAKVESFVASLGQG
ncbi:MAG: WXG100 family type VII secretion target, partial [Ktedonobacterales bacterium]